MTLTLSGLGLGLVECRQLARRLTGPSGVGCWFIIGGETWKIALAALRFSPESDANLPQRLARMLDEEIELLENIYIGELDIERNASGTPTSITIHVHPATCDNADTQYVRVTATFRLSPLYPSTPPSCDISSPRGLAEEELTALQVRVDSLLVSSVGKPVLHEAIELIREVLTNSNVPHGVCSICIDGFDETLAITKTDCYHYFHTHCMGRYADHYFSMNDDGSPNINAVPAIPCTLEAQVTLPCPVCRKTTSCGSKADLLKAVAAVSAGADEPPYVPSSDVLQLRRRMQLVFEKQRQKGGIIDIEAERSRLQLPPPSGNRAPPASDAAVTLPQSCTSAAATEQSVNNSTESASYGAASAAATGVPTEDLAPAALQGSLASGRKARETRGAMTHGRGSAKTRGPTAPQERGSARGERPRLRGQGPTVAREAPLPQDTRGVSQPCSAVSQGANLFFENMNASLSHGASIPCNPGRLQSESAHSIAVSSEPLPVSAEPLCHPSGLPSRNAAPTLHPPVKQHMPSQAASGRCGPSGAGRRSWSSSRPAPSGGSPSGQHHIHRPAPNGGLSADYRRHRAVPRSGASAEPRDLAPDSTDVISAKSHTRQVCRVNSGAVIKNCSLSSTAEVDCAAGAAEILAAVENSITQTAMRQCSPGGTADAVMANGRDGACPPTVPH